jgi:hypothetical protein
MHVYLKFTLYGGVGNWAPRLFGSGDHVTLGRGLVTDIFLLLFKYRVPFSLRRIHLPNSPNMYFGLFPLNLHFTPR